MLRYVGYRKKRKRKNKPWITNAILISIKHKQIKKLFKTHYLTNDPIKVRKYKTYSNKLNKLKEITRKNYFRNKFALNSGNMKATWKIKGMVINRKKSSSQLILTKLLYKNKLYK
jgi:hypothetical protein